VGGLRSLQVTPHVAEYAPNPKGRNWLSESERNDPGFALSQAKTEDGGEVLGG
jgi:hypothetical protein